MPQDKHVELARHLSATDMGMPYRDELVALLRENFTEEEVEVALLLPPNGPPLQPISPAELSAGHGLSPERVAKTLERLAERALIFSGRTPSGEIGYALHRAGFGFPQSFFWKGEETDQARKMSRLVGKYFNREVTQEAFGGEPTKPYRYIPIDKALRPDLQAVLPHDRMVFVLQGADRFAVAHCPCRVQAGLMGRGCEHPVEVCLKFDELAEFLVDRGLGREITREEARAVVLKSAEAGLVHFVDNAVGGVKHNCNCCGCACWNVGSIRRRKIPRDALMAVYFVRRTEAGRCTGCGACSEICPVEAVRVEDGLAVVDGEWCIGCGVCANRCDFEAVRVEYREGGSGVPADFESLHQRLLEQRKR
jgi:ferredoxin